MEKATRDPKKRFGAGVGAANMSISSSFDDDIMDFPTKYSVTVYLTQPFEGETHYKSTFKVLPSDSYHEMHSAGVPSGPGRDVKPTRASFPFDGSSHTHQAFPPPPSDAYQQIYEKSGRNDLSCSSPETKHIPFEGVSHYKDTYIQHPPASPEDYNYHPPSRPTAGSWMSPPAGGPSPKKLSPARKSLPFEGVSSTSLHYPPPPKEAYLQNQVAVPAAQVLDVLALLVQKYNMLTRTWRR